MLNLSRRETLFVSIGGAFVLAIFGYWFIISPAMHGFQGKAKSIERKTKDLKEVIGLQDEYLTMKAQMGDLEKTLSKGEKGVSPKFLEDLAEKRRIKENITSMNPKTTPMNDDFNESSVEIRIDKIPLEDLVKYLFDIENSSKFLKVKRLRIKTRYDDFNYHDITFSVSTLEPV